MFTRNSRLLKALSGAVVFLLAGCHGPGISTESTGSTGSIGRLQIDQAVAENLQAHRFDSNYRYYTLMDGPTPYAVVGLLMDYHIPDMWGKDVIPNEAQLSRAIDLVRSFPTEGSMAYGAYLLDSNNKKVGIWYSSVSVGVNVNNTNKTVMISSSRSWYSK